MAVHTAHTVRNVTGGVLDPECPRCAQYANDPTLLDEHNLRALWDEMMRVEFGPHPSVYQNPADGKAGRFLYRMAVALQRLGTDPKGV